MMYIVNDDIPLGCVYEGENGKTKYCPMLNHDDVPYCQYLEDDEAAIGLDERPVYCPIVEFPSADVVEVVRCKDCIFGHLYIDVQNGVTDSWIECRNPDGLNRDVSVDGYCSASIRKM